MARTTAKGMDKAKPAPAPDKPETTVEAAQATAETAADNDLAAKFERNLDRLTAIVEDCDFEGATALGDLRDGLIEVFKGRDKPWHLMTPSQQQDLGRHLESIAKLTLRKVVAAVASEESLTISGELLPKFAIAGDAVEAKLKLSHIDGDVLLDIYKMAGHRVVIVSADDKRFASARRDLPEGNDQTAMEFSDPDTRDRVEPPADDSDLAGGKDGDPPIDLPTFAIFDSQLNQYLDQQEDDFINDANAAGRWTEARALEIIDDFEGNDNMSAVDLPIALPDPGPEPVEQPES